MPSLDWRKQARRGRSSAPWPEAAHGVSLSADVLLAGRTFNRYHLVCYLQDGDRVFETFWTNGRGVEAMDPTYGLLDLSVYGRQESWEDSPPGWPQRDEYNYRRNGRPIAQWSRIEAGCSDDLGS